MRLPAQDGYELGATLYAASFATKAPRVAVVHGGGGIPASRYERFARFLAAHGITTLVYDYRGIGKSRPPTLRGFTAGLEDWAEYDSAAAVAWLRERFPHAQMTGIAHSIGTLLFGGAHNAAEQSLLVLIGAHTGYYGDYAERYRVPMTLMWHAVMPAMTRLLGYFPGRRLGLGEDLPAKFALQWAARRSAELRPTETSPDAARIRKLLDRCALLHRPAVLVSISDDAFATPEGSRRLMAYYPRLLPVEPVRFTPADAGSSRIGHFGFFSARAGALLWPRLLARLQAGTA